MTMKHVSNKMRTCIILEPNVHVLVASELGFQNAVDHFTLTSNYSLVAHISEIAFLDFLEHLSSKTDYCGTCCVTYFSGNV